MKKILVTLLLTTFVVGNVVSTLCFRACKKRIEITDFRHPKIVDSDWEYIIQL